MDKKNKIKTRLNWAPNVVYTQYHRPSFPYYILYVHTSTRTHPQEKKSGFIVMRPNQHAKAIFSFFKKKKKRMPIMLSRRYIEVINPDNAQCDICLYMCVRLRIFLCAPLLFRRLHANEWRKFIVFYEAYRIGPSNPNTTYIHIVYSMSTIYTAITLNTMKMERKRRAKRLKINEHFCLSIYLFDWMCIVYIILYF